MCIISTDEATDSMHKQETAQKNNHEAVLQDLAGIQDRARKVFDKISQYLPVQECFVAWGQD